MVNWKDIKTDNTGYYPEFDYIDIKDMVNKAFNVIEVTAFDNVKGPGVAMVVEFEGDMKKMVTHSIGVYNTVTSDAFMKALADDCVTVTLKEGKSQKTGKYFYYLD